MSIRGRSIASIRSRSALLGIDVRPKRLEDQALFLSVRRSGRMTGRIAGQSDWTGQDRTRRTSVKTGRDGLPSGKRGSP
jgi:hypothetical protein